MRNTSTLRSTSSVFLPGLALLLSLTSTTLAQENQEPTQPLEDNPEFRALHNPVISADGSWMAAEEHSDRGAGNVRVWSTQRDVTFTIERGQNPRISRDSRWVSALQTPPLEDSGTDKPTTTRAGQTLVLLDTKDGSRRTFDFVLSYNWTYTSSYLVYLQSRETKTDGKRLSKDKATKSAAKPTGGEREAGTLRVVHLEVDNVHTIENVAQHVTHQTHAQHQTVDLVSYVSHDDETARDTLHITAFKPGPNSGYRGKHVGDKIKGQCWAHDDAILAFIDNTETRGKDGKPRVSSALYMWNDMPGGSGPRRKSFRPRGRASGGQQARRDSKHDPYACVPPNSLASESKPVDSKALFQRTSRVFTRVDLGNSELGTLSNPVISADGAWVAAEERPDRGDGNVRVWATKSDKTFAIERGQNPRISRDSRWVSALQEPPLEESKTVHPKKKKRAGQTLVLLNTQSGLTRRFEFVLSYDVTDSSSYLVYLQSPETKADEEDPSKDGATKLSVEPAKEERKVGTLHMVHLKSDKVFTIANVAQHATHLGSDHVAFALHDKGTGRDQLRVAGLGPGSWGIRAIRDGEKIEGLRWARDVTTVGFLDSTKTTGKDGQPRVSSALYMWHVTGPSVLGGFTRVDTQQ